MAETPAPGGHWLLPALRRIGWLDWLMLLLALVSVGLVVCETWAPLSDAGRAWIGRCDELICALFAAEFLWRWRLAGWSRRHLLHNWYDLLGMIPLAQPALRGLRLFRLVRIVILLARFGMAADRALGEEFTFRLVDRFSDSIVEAISRPVTVAVLEEVAQVLEKGTYTRNIAQVLLQNRSDLSTMITDKLRDDPRTGRLKRVPFYDDIFGSVVDAGLDVVQEVLRDPRTDRLVADMLRQNITQLREAVARNQG